MAVAGADEGVLVAKHPGPPRIRPIAKPMFEAIAAGKLEAVTSELTLLETLVAPFRSSKLALAARYEAFLTRSRHLSLLPISREILRNAARS